MDQLPLGQKDTNCHVHVANVERWLRAGEQLIHVHLYLALYSIINSLVIIVIVPLRSAVPGQVIEGEHDTRFEPVLNRYRRAPGDLDETKLSCTLKMRVSYALILFCIIKESYQALETVFCQVSYFQLSVLGNMVKQWHFCLIYYYYFRKII